MRSMRHKPGVIREEGAGDVGIMEKPMKNDSRAKLPSRR